MHLDMEGLLMIYDTIIDLFIRSRPPDRQFGRNSNERDAECAFRLMQVLFHLVIIELVQNLGRIPFSILGWSDGGVTALFVAHKHADSVQRLVIWGATSYLTDDIVAVYRCKFNSLP